MKTGSNEEYASLATVLEISKEAKQIVKDRIQCWKGKVPLILRLPTWVALQRVGANLYAKEHKQRSKSVGHKETSSVWDMLN